MAPLVWWYRQDRDQLLEAVRVQTAMTHNNPAVLAGAAFIARTAWSVLAGAAPQAAMEEALEEGVADIDLDIRLRTALESAGKDTRTVIGRFGQMCGIASALPGAVHLISTYADDPKTALIENVMAGGDSAARGMVAGLVLGARHGVDAVPGCLAHRHEVVRSPARAARGLSTQAAVPGRSVRQTTMYHPGARKAVDAGVHSI